MKRTNSGLIQGLLNEIGIFANTDQAAMDIKEALADEDIYFWLEEETTPESGNAITQFILEMKEHLIGMYS